MKRCLLAAAAAHVLLLGLLYVDHVARSSAQAATREQHDRERHEQLHEQALEERRREWLAARPPADAGPLDSALMADARGGRRGPGPRGRTPSLLHLPGSGHRGAGVARLVDENAVLAELIGAKPVPARELEGEPAGVTWAFIDSWYTLGPFELEAPPLSVHGSIDLDARHVSKSGSTITWRFIQRTRPEIEPETMTPNSVHYAFTRLRSDRQRDVWMAFGADDSLQVWLDGALIWDCGEHWRGWALDEGARRVTLRAGESQLLVRLRNWPQVGAFSLLVRVSP